MPKAKLKALIRGASGTFMGWFDQTSKRAGPKIIMADSNCRRIIRKNTTIRKPPSEKQKAVRRWYGCNDLLWRMMEYNQRQQWQKYYEKERELGRTRTFVIKRYGKKKITGTNKEYGPYGYFMKKAMAWDLKEFLQDYLFAEWYIIEAYVQNNKLFLKAKIVSKKYDTVFGAPPKEDAYVIRQRVIP